MTKIFVEFLNFWPKFSIFWSKIFFMDFVSLYLAFCKKLGPYFENLIFYQFLSILVEKGPIRLTPSYFGPLATPPYEPDLSRKNFIRSENDS